MPATPSLLAWAEDASVYALGSWAVQATLLLVAGLLLARLPRLRPAHRHVVLLTALCLAALAPAGLIVPSSLRVQPPLPGPMPATGRNTTISASLPKSSGVRQKNAAAASRRPERNTLDRFALVWVRTYPALSLVALWLTVAVVRLLLLLVAAHQVARWVRRGRPLDRDRLYAACGYRVADIPVLETPAVQVPSVVGARRPVILLPVELSRRIDAGALGHVLFHEEGHARRRDPLFRLVSAVAETLLFWHPLVPLIHRELETASEDACDTHALERGAGRAAYARTLLSVLELALAGRARPLTCRLGKRGNDLKRRVTRILTGPPAGSPLLGYLSLGAMLPALGASVLLEVGPRPANPFWRSGAPVARRSGGQLVRSWGGQVVSSSRSTDSSPGNRVIKPSGYRALGSQNLNNRTSEHLNTRIPVSLAVKSGTWRPVLGSLPMDEGNGVPGESRDRLPRRDHLTVFVLDISGVQTAEQQEARRQILLRIAALPPADRFNVVAFNSRVLPYASSPVTPSTETIASIRSWMEVLPQESGSDLVAGLRHALKEEDVTSVILFSDGNRLRNTNFQTDLLEIVQFENRSYARVMAVLPEQQIQRPVNNMQLDRAKGESRAVEGPGGTELP